VPKQVTNVAADDALTTIYRLSNDEGEEVIAARIAERLGTRPASVAGMLSRLRRDELVRMDAKKRVALTKTVNVMGLEWWRAYEEAHLMEHSISDVTEPLIVKLLNSPVVSPFGYPIPGSNGAMHMSSRRVSDLEEGETGEVERVFEEDEELLRFFEEKGILPGARVSVLEVARYLGTVKLQVGSESASEIVVGSDAARLIWLRAR
jgi:DtxR family Mn-dependent transcriptional regulator